MDQPPQPGPTGGLTPCAPALGGGLRLIWAPKPWSCAQGRALGGRGLPVLLLPLAASSAVGQAGASGPWGLGASAGGMNSGARPLQGSGAKLCWDRTEVTPGFAAVLPVEAERSVRRATHDEDQGLGGQS